MSNQPSPFEILICDLNCALTASEFSYKPHHLRLTLLVLPERGDPSRRNHWFSRPCPAPLAIRLMEEAESRSFTCKLSPPRSAWSLSQKVRGILEAYVQRRIGLALIAHRAAWPIVYEAGGLSDLYARAGYQLQLLAVKYHTSIAEIRRAERFAKFVRLSAYHTLMAKDLETCHCVFHAIRTLSPRTSGHLFHDHSDRQSERSDAGMALLFRGARRRQFLRSFAH